MDGEGNPSGWYSAWAVLSRYPDGMRNWDYYFDIPDVRTGTVVALARDILATRDLSQFPILADALQDAGFADEQTLAELRSSRDRENNLFLLAWLANGPNEE